MFNTVPAYTKTGEKISIKNMKISEKIHHFRQKLWPFFARPSLYTQGPVMFVELLVLIYVVSSSSRDG